MRLHPYNDNILNLHPGTTLREDYLPDLAERGVTRYRLAKMLRLTQSQLDQLLTGKRNVTANIALRLGKAFGQTPEMWMGLQASYDLAAAQQEYGDEINQIETFDWGGAPKEDCALARVRS